jgi:hypothetical protein
MIKQVIISRNFGWALFLVLISTFSLKAQETEKTESKIVLKEDLTTKPQSQQNPGRAETQKNENRVFVPSEEISEDYAVPFPTDI